MRNSQKMQHEQRGAVAVEFALVFPLLLMIFGGMLTVGMGIWSRYMMLDYATSAARVCAFRPSIDPGSMPGCVQGMINTYNPSAKLLMCSGVSSNVAVQDLAADPAVKLVVVTLTCKMPWSPMVNVMPGHSLTGAFNITAVSSMPFMYRQS